MAGVPDESVREGGVSFVLVREEAYPRRQRSCVRTGVSFKSVPVACPVVDRDGSAADDSRASPKVVSCVSYIPYAAV
jgi:hypothetical protein